LEATVGPVCSINICAASKAIIGIIEGGCCNYTKLSKVVQRIDKHMGC
jgi:hypothetical protein